MDHQEIIEIITRIFEEELPKALEAQWGRKHKLMAQSITAEVLESVRSEVRRDHSENRTRIQGVDKAANSAAANAAIAVDRSNLVLSSVERLEKLVMDLLGEVRLNAGRLQGKFEAENTHSERRRKILEWTKWISSIGAGGAIYKLWHYIVGR